MRGVLFVLCLGVVVACSDDDTTVPDASSDASSDASRDASSDTSAVDAVAPDAFDASLPEPAADYFEPGPFPVGNLRVDLTDSTRSRTLPVEFWYPADESARADSETGQPIEAFETEARATEFETLLADAPSCVRRQTRSAAAPAPAEGETWPIVVFSHCHVCTRFDLASVAERLASFGIAVVAPDHEDNTLWDELAGTAAMVGETFLEVRVADLLFVLDTVLSDSDAVPETLRGRFDAERVGVMGHSFGSATAGVTASRDERVVAGIGFAAPLTALGGARINDVDTPFLFVIAQEDNSIGALGNNLMRNEFRRIPSESLLVEMRDTGHWNFSDYPGLIELFTPGCGSGTRQTVPDEAFDYLDADVARDIAGDLATAWFAQHLLDDAGGTTPIRRGHPSGFVEVETR